ncbi:MAG: putative 4,5-dihydroxyphthalate dehydrogenase [Firmicutes bacterium ADurb.Bin300]|nr:MAG: putative 4,5-dihydroxyphthalate dehydrogenase [Firmicutes bacterium ADurb.Bin300]HOD01984.1 Gfo/Idh/MocA family oxidoreductase [Clostridiales bacterium]
MKTVSVIGLGNRGTEYMMFIHRLHRKKMKIIAVCDIRKQALDDIAPKYAIPKDRQFLSTDEFFANGVISDALIITTQDASHFQITKDAINTGYKIILLEKPVSGNYDECLELHTLAREKGVKLLVCHVLRYSNYFGKIKEIIRSGALGDLITINHTENVGYFHFAHSFVRGNWNKEEESTPSILAKCCHDLDLIQWYANSKAKTVSSVGGLYYFNKQHAPEGAAPGCLDDCKVKDSCPYNAENLYIKDPFWKAKFVKYMRRTLTGKTKSSKADIYEALRNGDYGKCVFLNDNNVCDSQIVHIGFENGINAVLTMNAFSNKMFRQLHIIGTKGELIGYGTSLKLAVFGKPTKKVRIKGLKVGGHIEGDMRLIKSFVKLVNGEKVNDSDLTTIEATLPSHEIAKRAEESRKATLGGEQNN